MSLESVIEQIRQERKAQDKKWGQQNWPDGTGADKGVTSFCNSPTHHAAMEDAKLSVDLGMSSKHGTTWADIAKEEFFEALCETEWDRERAELIQTAAVLVAWIEAGDRRFFGNYKITEK